MAQTKKDQNRSASKKSAREEHRGQERQEGVGPRAEVGGGGPRGRPRLHRSARGFAASMRVVAVYSIKGGVGKTTAAVNLAWEAAKEFRVLLWDLDPAGSERPSC